MRSGIWNVVCLGWVVASPKSLESRHLAMNDHHTNVVILQKPMEKLAVIATNRQPYQSFPTIQGFAPLP